MSEHIRKHITFAGLMGIALFSSLGLPGLNGFVGEFLIFRGVFALSWVAAGISVLGALAALGIRRVNTGRPPERPVEVPLERTTGLATGGSAVR